MHAAIAVVIREEGVAGPHGDAVGIITWERIAELLEETVDLFSEPQA